MEFLVENDEILTIVNEIEEEMFRLYKKIDNSYKNKFRSLLTNISNTKNDVKKTMFDFKFRTQR